MDIGKGGRGEKRQGEACHIVALCDTHVNITIFG